MWKAILIGFAIGFAAMGWSQAAGGNRAGAGVLVFAPDRTDAGRGELGRVGVWQRLLEACGARPAYPGLA